MRIVSESEFMERITETLTFLSTKYQMGSVTGPGRSGAIAAVYASHILGIPFIPYGQRIPEDLGHLLIIDTATESGETLKKAARKYCSYAHHTLAIYQEPPRVAFWYEANKPQRFRHEKKYEINQR